MWHQEIHIVIYIYNFFSYTMYYTFHCELPHCTFHVFLSFLLIVLKTRYCSFKRKKSIIGQLNVQGATAENEEQYTLSNIMYIGFQNSCSFFEVLFDKQLLLKGRQINWKTLVVKFIFWQSYRLWTCNFTKKALL